MSVADLRAPSQAQKPELAHQKAARKQCYIASGITVDKWISEIGGGLNFRRSTFSAWVERVIGGELSTLVVAHQDHPVRFGFELLAHWREAHDCRIVVLSPEQEMVQDLDLMTIVDGFSSWLDGPRNYRKAIQKALLAGQGT